MSAAKIPATSGARERKRNKGTIRALSLKQIPRESVNRSMLLTASLTRSEQLNLNGRALWRDFASGDFRKMRFHLRGFWRALAE
jgi:hypothetical protein